MKSILKLIIIFLFVSNLKADEVFLKYLESALKNNPKLNSERSNLKSVKQNINISRSEFLPSLTLEGSHTSSTSSNRTDSSGSALSDTNLDTETKSIIIDQKIFQGFQGYNSLKKSKLEVEKATFELKKVEQEIILDTANVYFNLIFKDKNKKFNLSNVDLFERQVELDKARLQKGQITLTDLAQSESSLARANAKLITAETELLGAKANFERVIQKIPPENIFFQNGISMNLPQSLKRSIDLAKKNNPELLISKYESLIAEKNLNIEKSKISPTASLNYTKSENSELSSTIDKTDEEKVMATIRWPIIKGGKIFSSIKKSRFDKEKAKLSYEDSVNKVKTDTINAWSNYQSAESVLLATKAQLKASEIANEGITLEYDSGNTRTTLELIQSRSLLLDSRIENAKAERDYIISKFKLLSQIGDLSLGSIKN